MMDRLSLFFSYYAIMETNVFINSFESFGFDFLLTLFNFTYY